MTNNQSPSVIQSSALVCRPALPADTPAVLDLARHIWNGHDYIPYVWEKWLAQPEGLLAVGYLGPHLVGCCHLARCSANDWWLEGLRVHPDCEGQGFASHIIDFMLSYWEQHGAGPVRLATTSFRLPVHRICARRSFAMVAEYSPHSSRALEPQASSCQAVFQPLTVAEAAQAAALARECTSQAITTSYMDYEYAWNPANIETITRAVQDGHAWWWKDRQGVLVTWVDREDGQENLYLGLAACAQEQLGDLLLDARRLSKELGYAEIFWNAPLHQAAAPVLISTGFQRTWEHALYVFEKQKRVV